MVNNAAAQATAFFPSGKQIRTGAYPTSVAHQLEEISLCLLRKLLAPLVVRWQGKRARRLLLRSTLSAIAANDVEASVQQAAMSAMLFTSALGRAMPTLSGGSEDNADSLGGLASGDGRSTEGSIAADATSRRDSTRPPRASLTLAHAAAPPVDGEDNSFADNEKEEAGDKRVDALTSAERVEGHAASASNKGKNGSPITALSLEALFSSDMVAASPLQFTQQDQGQQQRRRQQQQHQGKPFTTTQQRDINDAMANIAIALRNRLKLRTYLQLEHIQSSLEPAQEVCILLSGTLRRRYPVVGLSGTATTASAAAAASGGGGGGGSSPSRSHSPVFFGGGGGGSPNSRRPSASGDSTTTTASTAPRARSGGVRATTRRGSQFHQMSQQAPPPGALAMDDLKAPLVLGELAVIGGFPVCEELRVESERCLIGTIDKATYCAVVATLPRRVQRRLMVTALQQRERLLPFYGPMTEGRLRLCPLLSMLGKDELAHVKDHLVPRVFAAGMVCSESTDPQHIFFIRNGFVRMEQEGFATVERGAATSPKNRTILVEGQTFGETPCIFRESLGDVFYALNHVDAYVLPFRVLIQLMKQQPEVQSVVYSCARAISVLREKDFEGVLRFNPSGENIVGLQGVSNRRSSMFGDAVHRRRSSNLVGGGDSASVHFTVTGPSSGPPGAAGASARRVTIYEEEGQPTAGGESAGLTGGKVSTSLVSAIRQMPLLSLIAPSEVIDETQRFWRCVRYEKGDVIAHRGEECNRVLFFFEGRAVIVLDENALSRELRPTPFGTADLAVLASAQSDANQTAAMAGGFISASPPASARFLQLIPQGHMVGYTCVLRHRWTRTILAVDDIVEVWELPRASLVSVLRAHGLERRMWTATQQVLQPLVAQKERFHALDYQPLCRPMPSSLWSEQPVVNVHPVRLCETSLFPVWREGDFPLDRTTLENVTK